MGLIIMVDINLLSNPRASYSAPTGVADSARGQGKGQQAHRARLCAWRLARNHEKMVWRDSVPPMIFEWCAVRTIENFPGTGWIACAID
jgi:hypothetical protein